MLCEICEKEIAEYRHKEDGEYYCKECLRETFRNMSFEDYLEESFIKLEDKE